MTDADTSHDAQSIERARDLLAEASNVFILTGAGLSAEAGLPTYRGESGLWHKVDRRRFTSLRAFEKDPEAVWDLCSQGREQIKSAKPSAAHLALAGLALGGRAVTIVTQNVDGLHNVSARQQAASQGDVDPAPAYAAELHGNLWRLRCLECSHKFEHRETIEPTKPPACPECSGRTRPDIVWFGEQPERDALERAVKAAKGGGVCLVIGTSAQVVPASKLPAIAVNNGAQMIEINPDPTPLTPHAAASLRAKAGEGLEQLLG